MLGEKPAGKVGFVSRQSLASWFCLHSLSGTLRRRVDTTNRCDGARTNGSRCAQSCVCWRVRNALTRRRRRHRQWEEKSATCTTHHPSSLEPELAIRKPRTAESAIFMLVVVLVVVGRTICIVLCCVYGVFRVNCKVPRVRFTALCRLYSVRK